MALNAADGLASFDAGSNKRLDLSPVLSSIFLNDTATLGALGMGPAVPNVEHKYGGDSLNAPSVTLTTGGGINNVVAAMDVSVADAKKLRIGALLQDEANAKTEVIQVTDINYATGALTIVRGYGVGGDPGEAHAASAVFAIIGQPVQENDKGVRDLSKNRDVEDTIITQIFKREVEVSGSQEAVSQNGMFPGVASEFKYQTLARTMELMVELNRAVLNSVKSASAGSDSVYRSMQGLRSFLVAGGNDNATVEAISEDVVNAMYGQCWDKGGNPGLLLGHAAQINKFSDFNTERFRVAPSDRMVGVFVERYLTEYGKELSLMIDRWARKDEVMLIDQSRAQVCPLQGRALFSEPLAKVGDGMRWHVIMEMTLKVLNKGQAHAIHRKLTA